MSNLLNIQPVWQDQVNGTELSWINSQIIQVQIQFNSCYCGIALTSIQLPDHCIILDVVRAGRMILAITEPSIYCGDYILAIALKPEIIPALKVILKKTHPVSWFPSRCSLT